jgi:peptidoglycan/LPS O-acetylase OafA/YrhL
LVASPVANRAAFTTAAREIRSLTAMRGVAALFVVVFHLRPFLRPHLDLDQVTPIFGSGYLWVDFFFLLSGFVLSHANGRSSGAGVAFRVRVRDFLAKRLARIYPLHVVALLGAIGLECVQWVRRPAAAFEGESWGTLLSHVIMVHAWGFHGRLTWNRPSWSISAEWAAYLLFPVLAVFAARVPRRAVLPLVAVLAACPLVLQLGLGRSLDLTADFGVLRCLSEFTLGVVLHRVWRGLANRHARVLGHDVVVAVCLLAAFLVQHMAFPLSDGATVAVFAGLLLSLACNDGVSSRVLGVRPLHWLGVVSYSIYMTHHLLLRGMHGGFELIGKPVTPHSVALFGALYIGLVLLVSGLAYHLVEEPARTWLTRLLLGQRVEQARPVRSPYQEPA